MRISDWSSDVCSSDLRSTLKMPLSVKKLDFEAELAVVIGQPGKNVGEHSALSHVFGYVTANDFKARESPFDIQPPQTTRAKRMDGFTPPGPWITTAEEVSAPPQLSVRFWDNRSADRHVEKQGVRKGRNRG